MPRSKIANAAADILTDSRALTAEELGRLVAGRGATHSQQPDKSVTNSMTMDRRFRQLPDGRWTMPAVLIEGATLTHRLSPREVETGMLALGADLGLLRVLSDYFETTDGEYLFVVTGRYAREATRLEIDAALDGPEGWLPAGAGELIQLRIEGGRVAVSAVTEPDCAPSETARRIASTARRCLFAAAVENEIRRLPPVAAIDELMLELLADDANLLATPLPPIGELLAAAGLEAHRGFVGLPGTNWIWVDRFLNFDDRDNPDDWTDDVDTRDDVDVDWPENVRDSVAVAAARC
jgi:hypothetical protein